MAKTYRLAILADDSKNIYHTSVLRYTHITAYTFKEARLIAEQIGALVCGWKVA